MIADMAANLDFCIRAVAALVMSLRDAGASSDDILRALEASARCENKLRLETMLGQITEENLYPEWPTVSTGKREGADNG